MRPFIFSIFLLLVFQNSFSQDCGFIDEYDNGDSWTYTNFNKKGKIENSVDYLVRDKRISGDSLILGVTTKLKDEKGTESHVMSLEMVCVSGNLYFSMDKFLNGMMQQLEGMDFEFTTEYMEIPVNPEIGQLLPDAQTNISSSMNGMTIMDMTITVSDRKIVRKESVTTEAGTFSCFVLEQTTTVKNKFAETRSTSKEWYNASYGMVRSEFYDKKGNIEGTTVLTNVER